MDSLIPLGYSIPIIISNTMFRMKRAIKNQSLKSCKSFHHILCGNFFINTLNEKCFCKMNWNSGEELKKHVALSLILSCFLRNPFRDALSG